MKASSLLGVLYGILITFPLSGCSPANPESFIAVRLSSSLNEEEPVSDDDPRVEFLKPGETLVVDDAVIANDLSGFFPGISGTTGAQFMPMWRHSIRVLKLIFVRIDKPNIAVYLTHDGHWGYEDRRGVGDRPAKAGVQQYLRALFTNVKVQEAASTQPKE